MKTQFMAALLAIGMTGCTAAICESTAAQAEITMEAIVQANSAETLFSRHSSVLCHEEGNYSDLTDLYVSPEFCYEKSPDYELIVDSEDSWFYTDVNGEKFLGYRWFAMSDEEKAEYVLTTADYTEPVVSAESTLKEKIEDVTDNEDGTLTVTTLISAEDIAEQLRGSDIEYPDEFYTSGQRFCYVIDSTTLKILSGTETVLAPDGEIPFVSYTVTHDAEQPEEMKTMAALVSEFRNGEKNSPRTITVVYDAGSEQEQSYSFTIDRKFKIFLYFRDGYDYLYNDPEKKEQYIPKHGTGDVTIYAFSEE